MAITFSKSSGLNDDLWKDTDVAVKVILSDVDKEVTDDDKLVKQMYNESKSKKWAEKMTGLTSFDSFKEVPEGESAPKTDIQQDFSKTIEHHTWMNDFTCTQEMLEDGKIDEFKTASQNFMRSWKRTRAEFSTAALITEGTTFNYGGRTYDKTTGDGKGLFATDHLGKKDGVANQSNVFTNEFGTDATMLYRLANIGRNFKNSSGQVVGINYDTIMIPGDAFDLEETIKRIIRSNLVVGSANNDVNTQKGLWQLVVNKRWVTGDATRPFIIMSSESNKQLMGSMFYNRVNLDVKNEVDLSTRNLNWNGRGRFGCGFNDWRHVIMGGAAAGTTLT